MLWNLEEAECNTAKPVSVCAGSGVQDRDRTTRKLKETLWDDGRVLYVYRGGVYKGRNFAELMELYA